MFVAAFATALCHARLRPLRATPTRQASVRSSVTMLFGGSRRIRFAELDETQVCGWCGRECGRGGTDSLGAGVRQAISWVRSFPSRFRRWGVLEWECFDAPPLEFSDKPIPTGTRLRYYTRGAGGGLEEDGNLEVTVDGPAVVFRPARGSVDRSRQEAVIFALALEAARRGALSEIGRLSPGLYAPSGREGRMLAKIESACASDKAGQYRRFRKEVGLW